MTDLPPSSTKPPLLPDVRHDAPRSFWQRSAQWLNWVSRYFSQTATHDSHGVVELPCPQCGRPMIKGTAALETGKPIAEVAQECKPRAKTPKRTSCEPCAARTSGYSKKTTS